jgi:hypothetical protein
MRSLVPGLVAVYALLVPQAAHAVERVIEDSPGRLILEVEVDAYQAISGSNGSGASRLIASGFVNPSQTGAPDLPWLHLQVATGDRMPTVTVEPLEWADIPLPGGLAGVPRWITNKQSEPARDAALFAGAGGIRPDVSDIRLQRGLKVREITLPIASYSGGAQATLMKKFRVRVDFPNPGSSPAAGVKTWLEFAGVKNTNGGQYLTAIPKPSALARRAAAQATSNFDPSAPRLKITIGDRELDSFDEDGVYALTYTQVASLAGSGLIGTSVSTLRMYTGPQDTGRIAMDTLIGPTLREIPIEVRDANANTTFDAGDSILFYAHGTSIWKPIPGATGAVRWEFKSDMWSFENRYYLQWGGDNGLRLATAPVVATSDTVTTVPHYLRAERDVATGSCDPSGLYDSETGPNWHWYRKDHCSQGPAPGFGPIKPMLTWQQLRRSTVDSLPGRVSDSVWFGFYTYLGPATDFFIPWSGSNAIPYSSQAGPGAWYALTGLAAGNATGLDSLKWNGTNPRFEGYSVRYTRNLQWRERRDIFPALTSQRVAYKVSGVASGVRVLRLESGIATKWIAGSNIGSNFVFTDSVSPDANIRYVLHGNTPLTLETHSLALEAQTNSNAVIQKLSDGSIGVAHQDPEYLIIAPTALLSEAIQLRDYRGDDDRPTPFVTSVVRVEDIYREWSGGRLSPVAIRDFLRWAVNRWSSTNSPGRLRYVVLMGDGHYDYRNLLNGSSSSSQPNHIPPFNWLNNDDHGNPMSTDDFFAVLDSGAHWLYSNSSISVGRLPFKTRMEASTYLTKIKQYENPKTSGEWRSRYLLIADDQMQRDKPDGAGNHTAQAETLGNWISAQQSGMRPEKVYMLDYLSNAAYLKPEATQDLINQYNRGTLFSTYFGHGAYNQMADEVLLKTNDGLSRLKNVDKNFFMTLFSCTVGRFEKLADEGMSEQFLRQKDYGAIGTVSAARETYADPNGTLGYAFAKRLFAPSGDTVSVHVGDALRLAKVDAGNNPNEGNKQKYILQGEPVLVLSRQGLGLQLNPTADTLQSLGCDTISGRVTRGSGRGAVSVRIVSGDVEKTFNPTTVVQKRGKILFERTIPYVDSTFSLQYFIPRDVPFGDSTAKIQIFAWDSLELRESSLLVSNLRISGTATSSCMVNDQRGPNITVSGCNTREGGNVDFADKVKIGLPYCMQITVSDTGGGVLAGEGPDQGTTVQVVGSVAPFQPQAGVDELSLKTYQLTLSKQEIAEGSHLLKVSARDGFGNVSQREITLDVSQDTTLTFVRAFNVPNPLKRGETTFWFSTTLPDDEGFALRETLTDRLRFDVRVFNQSGYMVREFRNARSGETKWNGKDAWGQTLANGVYFYDVTATWTEDKGGPLGGRRVSKKNILVISR